MTKGQIRKALSKYGKELRLRGFKPNAYSKNHIVLTKFSVIEHAIDMLKTVRVLLREDKLEKANRWLGFIQGCLWASGMYTIKELREDNRSKKKGE